MGGSEQPGGPDEIDALDGRSETVLEKADRNWNDILQELRAVQTGTQIITGFLLAVAFQPRFAELEAYERGLYLVLVVLAGFATVLGLAPVITHRQFFGLRQKERLVRSANRLLIALLVVVSLLAAGVTSLIFDVVVGRRPVRGARRLARRARRVLDGRATCGGATVALRSSLSSTKRARLPSTGSGSSVHVGRREYA